MSTSSETLSILIYLEVILNGKGSSKKKKKLMKKNGSEITESGDDLLGRPQEALSTLNEEGDHKKKKKKYSME